MTFLAISPIMTQPLKGGEIKRVPSPLVGEG